MVHNYLVFQPMSKYFKLNGNTLQILSWQSQGLSNGNADPPNASLSPSINYVGNKIRVRFTGSCLSQSNNISYTHKTIANVYIVYELGASSSHNNDPTLKHCLIGAVTFTKKLILIYMVILVMELGLIEDEASHFMVLDFVKMY